MIIKYHSHTQYDELVLHLMILLLLFFMSFSVDGTQDVHKNTTSGQ